MNRSSHRNLIVWSKARQLVVNVYVATQSFPSHEVHGLQSQMRRASISVISNISEGAGRHSDRDKLRFLYVARGSVLELEAQVIVAEDLGYLESDCRLLNDVLEVCRLINGFIRAVNMRL